MENLHKTRFIAANYSNLQGLKTVPYGLLLLSLVLWADGQTGPASDLTLPILLGLAAVLLLWAVFRYYRTHYGKVESTPRQKRLELILGIGGLPIALAAFIIDTTGKLPISLIGLAFAASIIVEYLRMQFYSPGRYLLPLTLVSSVVMLVISILPLLGAGEWWLLLGLRAQLFRVLVVASAVIIVYGLIGHWYFVRQLSGLGR